ncbi:MAG: hypothetical protein ACQEW9_02760 [Bacteroidota bacterium]|uniref:Lipoprotein n=1 Tax=Algoriphagus faecimaris TaxID=686796 RepID=A0A1G6NVC6_9BACT|nr:hypothetical protein [Algoriphagus faecimaris]SDC71749.1 hypothetical protein SAMN04488104_100498 [Algoriphagus faecimaris]
MASHRLILLFLVFSILVSCENAPGISSPSDLEVLPYYDMKGLLEQEIEKLEGVKVTKTTRVNGEINKTEVNLTREQWKDEFDAFFRADINRSSYLNSYTTEVDRDILIHRLKPEEKSAIKEIQVRIVDDRPVWISFKTAKESPFYTSYTNGAVYFNNRNKTIDHYSIESTQKIWFLKANNMKIQGVIK